MRALPLLAVGALTCGEPAPPCTTLECEASCAKSGIAAVRAPPQARPVQVLSAAEVEQFRPLLDDLRAGARVVDNTWGLCRGEGRCEQLLVQPDDPLPAGVYHVEIPYRLPRLARPGDWSVELLESCLARQGSGSTRLEREDRRHEVFGLDDTEGVVRGLTFTSPAPHGLRRCAWRAIFRDPNGNNLVLDAHYAVPEDRPVESYVPVTPLVPPPQASAGDDG